jgi:hypothetical protein
MAGKSARGEQGAGADDIRLVLIETLGNQAHVFASNVLREIIGASEQILLSGTSWVVEAMGKSLPDKPGRTLTEEIETFLTAQPAIGTAPGRDYEAVILSSGKAVVLANGMEKARALVTRISLMAQCRAPGLQVLGAISEAPVDLTCTSGSFHAALKALFDRHLRLRGEIGSALPRFLRLPFSAECASTGAAAAGFDSNDPDYRPGERRRPFSASTLAKRGLFRAAMGRLALAFGGKIDFGIETGERRTTPDWWSVVHADGNGLGQLFLSFDQCLPPHARSARDYIQYYRGMSLALDSCTRQACRKALDQVWPNGLAQLKPVVLAGDDLTVVCDGASAVAFTKAFITFFEQETEARLKGIVFSSPRASQIVGAEKLTAAAGIAIVKPHHPFHRAYELADDLCVSAKACKKAAPVASAIDFHVAFDQASDLKPIRQAKTIGRARLWGGPYVLSDAPATLQTSQPQRLRSMAMLDASLQALTEKRPADLNRGSGLRLGRSQQHDLRTALFLGEAPARLALQRLANRPEIDQAFALKLLGGTAPFDPSFGNSAMLLDAMDLVSLPSAKGAP